MSHFPPSIFTVLTRPGPSINRTNSNLSGYQPGLGCRIVTEITDWDDLTLSNVIYAYADILDQEHPGQPTYSGLVHVNDIATVPDVKQMEADFLHHLLEPSLVQGGEVIASRLSTSNATTTGLTRLEIRRDCRIGLAQPSTAFFWGAQMLVLGAARRDADWDFLPWASDRGHPTAQLAGYSTNANTRYAYSITEAGITLCQYYLVPGTHGQLGVRCKVVPLDAHGIDTLTPGLALWAVAMMAMNESHRSIVGVKETARLDQWIALFNVKKQAVYKNVVSGRERKLLPDGGKVLRS